MQPHPETWVGFLAPRAPAASRKLLLSKLPAPTTSQGAALPQSHRFNSHLSRVTCTIYFSSPIVTAITLSCAIGSPFYVWGLHALRQCLPPTTQVNCHKLVFPAFLAIKGQTHYPSSPVRHTHHLL